MKKTLYILLLILFAASLSQGVFFAYADVIAPETDFVAPVDTKYTDLALRDTNHVSYDGFAYSESNGLYTGTSNRTLSVTFSGVGIEFYATFGRDKGRAIIKVDGSEYGIADSYSENNLDAIFVRVSGLADGEHVVSLTTMEETNLLATGKYIQIKRIRLIQKISDADVITPDESLPDDVTGVNKTVTAANLTAIGFTAADGILVSQTAGDNIKYIFRGNALRLYGNKGEGFGKLKVEIDGIFKGTIDFNFSQSAQNALVYGTGSIGYGLHELILVNVGNARIELSGLTVYRKDGIDEENTSIYYDDKEAENYELLDTEEYVEVSLTDKNVVTYIDCSYSAESGIYAKKEGASITFDFTGYGLEVDGAFARDKGRAAVYIDGEYYCNINLYSTVSQTKTCLVVNGLSFERHVVKLTVLADADVDATDRYVNIKGARIIGKLDGNDLKCDFTEPSGYTKYERGTDGENIVLNGFAKTSDALESQVLGDYFEYTFRACAVWIKADTSALGGKFGVYIDGNYIGLVNTYSETAIDNAFVFASSVMQEGIHTLKIVAEKPSLRSSGRNITITAFTFYGEEDKNPDNIVVDAYDLVADTAYSPQQGYDYYDITLNGTSIERDGFLYRNSHLSSSAADSFFTVEFRGTGLEICAVLGADRGRVAVYVDDKLYGTATAYRAAQAEGLLILIKNLPHTSHRVKIVLLEKSSPASTGRTVEVTKIRNINKTNDAASLTYIDSAFAGITNQYMSVGQGSQYYDNTVLYGNRNNAYFAFTFRGSEICVYGTKSNNSGVGSVYLDGEFYGTFSAKSSGSLNQKLWIAIGGLDCQQNHTIVVINEKEYNSNDSSSYLSFDYFIVGDYSAAVFDKGAKIPNANEDDPVANVEFTAPDSDILYYTGYSKTIVTDGGYFTETYASGGKMQYGITQMMFDTSDVDFDTAGTYTVWVNYEGNQYSFEITFIADEVERVSLISAPEKLTYKVGEYLDLSGGKVSVNYISGREDLYDLDDNNVIVAGFDREKSGTNELTVLIDGIELTAKYDITVNQNEKSGCGSNAATDNILLFIVVLSFIPLVKRNKRATF